MNHLALFLSAAALAQGLFLLVVLFSSRFQNRTALYSLAIAITAALAMLYSEFAERAGLPVFAEFGMLSEALLVPAIYVLIQSLLSLQSDFRRHLIHLIPIVLFSLIAGAQSWMGAAITDPPGVIWWLAAKFVLSVFYIGAAILFVDRTANLDSVHADIKTLAGRIQPLLITLLFALVGIYTYAALSIIGVLRGGADGASVLVLTLGLFLAAWWIVMDRRSFDLPVRTAKSNPEIWNRIEHVLEREKAYLDPDLSLERFARSLGYSPREVSSAVRTRHKGGFPALIARLRSDYLAELLADSTLRNRNVLELALEAGFNSKATAYRTFRSNYDMSPARYRQLH